MQFTRKHLGCAALVSIAFVAAGVAADEVEVEATIQDVSESERSLTVELAETGATQTFRIDEETEISFEQTGRAVLPLRSGFDDLQAGQNVTLRFDDEILDDEWVILRIITIG